MSYRSIRNNTVYNLKNCDEEPIHIPGSIQPMGFLVAVDKSNGLIKFCSENVEEFTGVRFGQVLDKEPESVFGTVFGDAVKGGKDSDFTWTIDERVFSGQVHSRGDFIVVECEYSGTGAVDDDIYTSSRQLLQYVEGDHTLVQLCQTVASEIKSVTGYDRVMIYRFDAGYNGEVIAEAREEHLEGFLGLHYPHTDIPAQARQLYIINQLRLISDVNYEPVPIYTTSKDGSSTLDMSLCALRSVSPIHLEYLRNMGVFGTLTISLLHRGRLWGLIACHHYSPRYITLGMRRTSKLLGHFIVSQIDVRILNEEFEKKRAADEAYDKLTSAKLSLGIESVEQLIQSPEFLRMCNATGVVIVLGGLISKKGTTPDNEQIRSLSATLAEATNSEQFHTEAVAEWDKRYADLAATVPGLNYYSLGRAGDCVIWFRTETTREVTWAGDPNKAIEKNATGLSPRKSFLAWKQVVKGKSRPWESYELETCAKFVTFFQNHLRAVTLQRENEQQEEVVRILKAAKAELENVNWIATHDLQEPLRKIRMLSSMMLHEEMNYSPTDFVRFAEKVNRSAESMQQLIHGILAYTRTNGEAVFDQVNLGELVAGTLQDMDENVVDKKAVIDVGVLPVVSGIPVLLKQLFVNLLSNSLKFADDSRMPHITVSVINEVQGVSGSPGEYHLVAWADNGIGFDPAFNQKVLDLFARLHAKDRYPGSGMGLALCKKIMLRHSGFFWAFGEQGTGAKFVMAFPR